MEDQNSRVDKMDEKLEKIYLLQLIETKDFLNTEETAYFLGFKPRTIRKLADEGKLDGFKYKKTGYLFFEKESLKAYQRNNLRHVSSFD
ncbi:MULTISPECIES: helix-turn-helix domain-containing protein [unclassified Aureispira]|uniref:helix-turn-helix domain-containing protein n=1 Tax=unclassified Aureispira TaxID=2649989 RepID=UPI0006966E1E|nr:MULTISPECIES: helix-turn-helix domain-containing protein [unclassified Aureispira]WMX13206.1 helix-turn-helix domain-containing protein [Aureispira sp. CCB-E]